MAERNGPARQFMLRGQVEAQRAADDSNPEQPRNRRERRLQAKKKKKRS